MARKSVIDEAAEWFVELDTAERIEDKWEAFERWAAQSPEHEEAFRKIEDDWLATQLLDLDEISDANLSDTTTEHGKELWRKIRTNSRAPRKLVVAGFLAGAALTLWHFSQREVLSDTHWTWVEFKTAVGETRRITFPDGTEAQLNTDTTLQASVGADHRQARLDHGEARFSVAHDPQRPFVVHAGPGHVDALETMFTVSSRSNRQLSTLVSKGKVQVCVPAQNPKVVEAQHAATATERGVEVVALDAAEIDRRLAWTQGKLSFAGESLEEVVEEFNRYNQEQLHIVDPNIRELSVSGVFDPRDPEGFATLIRRSLGVDVGVTVHKKSDGAKVIDLAGNN